MNRKKRILNRRLIIRFVHDRKVTFEGMGGVDSSGVDQILNQSSGRSPAGAIFTSFGSNWPSTVTRSRSASMTSRMFL